MQNIRFRISYKYMLIICQLYLKNIYKNKSYKHNKCSLGIHATKLKKKAREQ